MRKGVTGARCTQHAIINSLSRITPTHNHPQQWEQGPIQGCIEVLGGKSWEIGGLPARQDGLGQNSFSVFLDVTEQLVPSPYRTAAVRGPFGSKIGLPVALQRLPATCNHAVVPLKCTMMQHDCGCYRHRLLVRPFLFLPAFPRAAFRPAGAEM